MAEPRSHAGPGVAGRDWQLRMAPGRRLWPWEGGKGEKGAVSLSPCPLSSSVRPQHHGKIIHFYRENSRVLQKWGRPTRWAGKGCSKICDFSPNE